LYKIRVPTHGTTINETSNENIQFFLSASLSSRFHLIYMKGMCLYLLLWRDVFKKKEKEFFFVIADDIQMKFYIFVFHKNKQRARFVCWVEKESRSVCFGRNGAIFASNILWTLISSHVLKQLSFGHVENFFMFMAKSFPESQTQPRD
jgi:hypothetical protein